MRLGSGLGGSLSCRGRWLAGELPIAWNVSLCPTRNLMSSLYTTRSFAAAAALDGSFCVVPNSEYARRSNGGNKGGTLVVSPASTMPRSLHNKQRKQQHSPKSSPSSSNSALWGQKNSPSSSQEAAGIGNLLKTLQALTEEVSDERNDERSEALKGLDTTHLMARS